MFLLPRVFPETLEANRTCTRVQNAFNSSILNGNLTREYSLLSAGSGGGVRGKKVIDRGLRSPHGGLLSFLEVMYRNVSISPSRLLSLCRSLLLSASPSLRLIISISPSFSDWIYHLHSSYLRLALLIHFHGNIVGKEPSVHREARRRSFPSAIQATCPPFSFSSRSCGNVILELSLDRSSSFHGNQE